MSPSHFTEPQRKACHVFPVNGPSHAVAGRRLFVFRGARDGDAILKPVLVVASVAIVPLVALMVGATGRDSRWAIWRRRESATTERTGGRPLHRRAAMAVAVALTGLGVCVPAATADQAGKSVTGSPTAARAGTLQRALDGLVRAGAPGALLYTYDAGHVQRFHSGLANIAAGTPMRLADRFRVGSLTKTYVSTVVLQLVAEHRLRLTDPVRRYLPRLLTGKPRITVRELLNHTSGVYDFNNDPRVSAPYLKGRLGHVWTPSRLVRIAMSHPFVARPGSAYHYSNTNYLLAGLVAEAVGRHSLGEQLRHRIFQPAHLHATTFTTSRRLPPPAAHGYFTFTGTQPTDITSLYPYPWASGAAVATVSDVARFYRHLFGPATDTTTDGRHANNRRRIGGGWPRHRIRTRHRAIPHALRPSMGPRRQLPRLRCLMPTRHRAVAARWC